MGCVVLVVWGWWDVMFEISCVFDCCVVVGEWLFFVVDGEVVYLEKFVIVSYVLFFWILKNVENVDWLDVVGDEFVCDFCLVVLCDKYGLVDDF